MKRYSGDYNVGASSKAINNKLSSLTKKISKIRRKHIQPNLSVYVSVMSLYYFILCYYRCLYLIQIAIYLTLQINEETKASVTHLSSSAV